MLIAGHETTAHTLHYALLKLAQNPILIAEFQQAIERRFGSKPFSEWKYPEDFDNMFVKNDKGDMVPYSAFMTLTKRQGLNCDENYENQAQE